ncbi:anthranilate 1,2-dioxygenase small subunit AndAd [uncultured Ramlibacter sp.]|uniref:anthranilate 1,2-dioxygenase small subunit AndAd n=1 Tax=uncultured Ramlibacter sp. TaxID=260755 RepID=UPI00262BADCC|nr:anthranilate 1,2-dioxygenase small subunit AndAd [uncultured Ramlibacter sp.]
MLLWFEIQQLQERYSAALDNDRLEEWASLFTHDCNYEIVPRENADLGLPIGLIHCDNQRMLRDRVLSLRHANIYETHSCRHLTSGLQITAVDDDTVEAASSYVVVQTRTDGASFVYQAGRYHDRIVRTPEGWRYKSRRAIYDTSRVMTLLATPI